MSHNYKKIQYASEGSWGSTEIRNMYIHSNNTCDVMTVYDDNYEQVMCYSEGSRNGIPDMGQALVKALTEYDNLESMTREEIQKIKPIEDGK